MTHMFQCAMKRALWTSALRGIATSQRRSADLLVAEAQPYVFHVKMNRPQRRNTFTMDVWREMRTVFDDLSVNPKCRAIVLSGEGKSFCAGIDLQEGLGDLMGMMQNEEKDVARKARFLEGFIFAAQDGYTALERCRKPVICAVHSHCFGAGFSLITAADIRYAAKDAVFSIKEVDVGLAADVGALARTTKITGNDSLTRELAYTARNMDAEEALKFGLVSRVFDDQAACVEGALKLAETIAERSPIAVQGSKVHLNYGRNHTIEEALDYIKVWNMSQLQSEDLLKAGMAAMSKSKAEFEEV